MSRRRIRKLRKAEELQTKANHLAANISEADVIKAEVTQAAQAEVLSADVNGGTRADVDGGPKALYFEDEELLLDRFRGGRGGWPRRCNPGNGRWSSSNQDKPIVASAAGRRWSWLDIWEVVLPHELQRPVFTVVPLLVLRAASRLVEGVRRLAKLVVVTELNDKPLELVEGEGCVLAVLLRPPFRDRRAVVHLIAELLAIGAQEGVAKGGKRAVVLHAPQPTPQTGFERWRRRWA